MTEHVTSSAHASAAAVQRVPTFVVAGAARLKTYTFPAFPAAVDWVRRVADVAELQQHHPDIDIRYTRITVSLSTHDSGGITGKDITLARAIEAL